VGISDNLALLRQMARINAMILDLPDALSGPIKDTLVTQAALVATEIKSVAHEDLTSATPGALKASVRVEEAPPKGGKFVRVFIKAGGKTTMKSIKNGNAGFSYEYDYARAQEFGTQKEPAHPFFFPIWRARRKDVRAAVRKAVKTAAKDVFR
jgi:HK97 gp10 family phage protein